MIEFARETSEPTATGCGTKRLTVRPEVDNTTNRGRVTHRMAYLVYIDETGSVGKGAKKQPLITLAAVLVDEDKVQPLADAFRNPGLETP
jgi:hypothetical protein